MKERLDILLVKRNLAPSREKAKAIIKQVPLLMKMSRLRFMETR